MRFFYRSGRLITALASHAVSVFRHGSVLLAQREAQASQLLATDAAGSVLSVIEQDETAARYVFGPYGVSASDAKSPVEFGFNGERREADGNRYWLTRRLYEGPLMRFGSYDPLSPFKRRLLNGYAYCFNDPVNYRDPSGATGNKITHSPLSLRHAAFTGLRESGQLPALDAQGIVEYKQAKRLVLMLFEDRDLPKTEADRNSIVEGYQNDALSLSSDTIGYGLDLKNDAFTTSSGRVQNQLRSEALAKNAVDIIALGMAQNEPVILPLNGLHPNVASRINGYNDMVRGGSPEAREELTHFHKSHTRAYEVWLEKNSIAKIAPKAIKIRRNTI